MNNIKKPIVKELEKLVGEGLQGVAATVLPCTQPELMLQAHGYELPRFYFGISGEAEVKLFSLNDRPPDVREVRVDPSHCLMTGQGYKQDLIVTDSNTEVWSFCFSYNDVTITINKGIEKQISSLISVNTPYHGALISLLNSLTIKGFTGHRAELFARAQVVQLLVIILNLVVDESCQCGQVRQGNRRQKFISMEVYVLRRLNEDLSRERLCEYFGLTIRTFSNLFNYWTKGTYKKYLNHLRLDKARNILLLKNKKTFELAETCGFNSSEHFVYTFRTHFAMPPRKMRTAILDGRTKTLQELEKLYYYQGFEFIPQHEFTNDADISILISDLSDRTSQHSCPTIVYLANEASGMRVVSFMDEGVIKPLLKIEPHLRARFNTDVGQLLIIMDEQDNIISYFITGDKPCQGIITK